MDLNRSLVEGELKRAQMLAQEGRHKEALSIFGSIFEPLLENPRIFRTWLELEGTINGREAVGRLVERMEGILESVREVRNSLEIPGEIRGQIKRPLASRTLARLFWNQGHRREALVIYEALLEKDPHDTALRIEYERCLESMQSRHDDPAREDFEVFLRGWMEAIRERKCSMDQTGCTQPEETPQGSSPQRMPS